MGVAPLPVILDRIENVVGAHRGWSLFVAIRALGFCFFCSKLIPVFCGVSCSLHNTPCYRLASDFVLRIPRRVSLIGERGSNPLMR